LGRNLAGGSGTTLMPSGLIDLDRDDFGLHQSKIMTVI
jgi:hypothetical protein